MFAVAAYMLALLGGNDNPDAAAINKILAAAGVAQQPEDLEVLLAQVAGKDINELLEQGKSKMGSVPVGVASSGAAASSSGSSAAAAAAPEPEKEESEADMGFSLFD